jgi:hypothetical protein
MIDFACTRCGDPMSVPADLAGTDVQCPACGLLLSVPLPSDLANVNPDGTLRLAEAVRRDDPERVRDLTRIFGTQRVDDDGEQIDNRTLPEEIELAPMPVPAKRIAPQYDPVTGELVTALAVAPPLAAPAPPAGEAGAAGAGLTIDYRTAGAARHEPIRVTRGQVPLALFQPMNVVVMSVLVVAHLLMNVGLVIVNIGIVFFVIGPLVIFVLIAGHYGNVVDEVGPTDMDELPRPLRQVSWTDDLWGPFRDVMASVMIAGAPLLACGWLGRSYELPPVVWYVATAATAVTWWFFPAILLTLRTSGSLANLRPDRVLGVARQCGRGYLPVALLGFVAPAVYLLGSFASFYTTLRQMAGMTVWEDVGAWGSAPVTFALLLAGIYAAHLLAWQVGLLYRMYQPKFPWVNQEHVRKVRRKPLKPLTAQQLAALRAAKHAPPGLRRQAAVEALQARSHA